MKFEYVLVRPAAPHRNVKLCRHPRRRVASRLDPNQVDYGGISRDEHGGGVGIVVFEFEPYEKPEDGQLVCNIVRGQRRAVQVERWRRLGQHPLPQRHPANHLSGHHGAVERAITKRLVTRPQTFNGEMLWRCPEKRE